jgi:multiple sugar transport system permease protein
MRRIVAALAVNGTLILAAALTLMPLLWMLSASLMPAGEATAVPPRLLPSAPTLEHYRTLFTRLDLGRALLNSTGLAAGVTLLALVINSLAGYAFAKLPFRGRERLFSVLLAVLVVPAQVTMLPLFLELKALGLVNTYAAVAVPGLASVFGIFLVRQYALGIPDGVLDAARVDGAGELRVPLRRVPAARPDPHARRLHVRVCGTTSCGCRLVLADERRYTPVALATLAGEHVQDVGCDGGRSRHGAARRAALRLPPALLHRRRNGRRVE